MRRTLDWYSAAYGQGMGCDCNYQMDKGSRPRRSVRCKAHRGRPPTEHRGINADAAEQGNDGEEEPVDIQMKILDEEDTGETAEDVARKQFVIFSRIGQSYNFTIIARDLLKYGPHLGSLECKYINGEVATGHSKECKIMVMVEMDKDENEHRIDEGKVSFNYHDEEKSDEGVTPEKARPKSNLFRRRSHPAPAATWQCEGPRADMMTCKIVEKSKRPKQAATAAFCCSAQ